MAKLIIIGASPTLKSIQGLWGTQFKKAVYSEDEGSSDAVTDDNVSKEIADLKAVVESLQTANGELASANEALTNKVAELEQALAEPTVIEPEEESTEDKPKKGKKK